MKKISNLFLWVFVCVFAGVPLGAQTERVASPINYNPSRMGVFSYLRVMDLLNTPGGARASNLNIYGYDAVSLIGSGKKLNITNFLTGQEYAEVNLPAAILSAVEDANDKDYQITGTPLNSGSRGTVNVYAGAKLETASHSYVNVLGLKDKARVAAGTVLVQEVIVDPTIIPDSTPRKFIKTTNDKKGKEFDSFEGNGLVLDSFAVSKPPISVCSDTKKCEYQWTDMTFKNGTQATVLAIKSTVSACSPTKGDAYWDHCDTVQIGSEHPYQTGSALYEWIPSKCKYDAIDTTGCSGSGSSSGGNNDCYWKKSSGTSYHVSVYSNQGCPSPDAYSKVINKVCTTMCDSTPSGKCGTKPGAHSGYCYINCSASPSSYITCEYDVKYDKYTCEC